MQIKAYAIEQKGGAATPFAYERDLGPQDVLVRITHRSIARGDVQFIDNDWGDTHYPLVPCHEIVGLIEAVGGDVRALETGDRVGVGYQLAACFECTYCARGLEQFCTKQTVVGVNAYGGLAEHVVVDHRFAFRLPDKLESAAAPPLLSSGLTVFSASLHAQLRPRSRVAVLGIGGLGRLALQFLRAMGHHTAGISRSPDKRALIEQLGAEYITTPDNHRFDFILSTVNAPFDLNAYLALLEPDGQMCLVAAPTQPVPLRAGLLYDYGRRRLYGSYVGSRADTVQMLELAAERGIVPTVEVLPFAQHNAAIARIRNNQAPTALILEST